MDVRDCVRAYYYLMASTTSCGKVFNVCGSDPLPMRFYTDRLIEISGLKNVERVVDDALWRPIDIHYQHGNTSMLEAATGWELTIPIEKTLEDLYAYWKMKEWK